MAVTFELIERVTHRLQSGVSQSRIAVEMGCARKTVRLIRDGKHPLQQQRQRRCRLCGGRHVSEAGRCLVAEARAVQAIKRRGKGQLWNPYEEHAA